jgi:hypothetical protein
VYIGFASCIVPAACLAAYAKLRREAEVWNIPVANGGAALCESWHPKVFKEGGVA